VAGDTTSPGPNGEPLLCLIVMRNALDHSRFAPCTSSTQIWPGLLLAHLDGGWIESGM